MELRISSYLARVSWFRRKNHKKKIQNKTKASYKVDFHAFFFLFLLQGLLQGGKFGNNELNKETFVFDIFWEILYHSESKTVMNVFHSRSAYACVQTNTNI